MRDFDKIDSTKHQPRIIDKKKRHSKGFNEDIKDKRAQRVSFKKYMQQIEEQELLDDLEDME